MKVRIAVVKTPAPQAARSPSGTPVTSSLHPPCLPISLEPTTGRPSNISVRRKIRRGLPDEARRRPDLTRHNRLASFLQHCLFRLRVEEPYLARVDHPAHRLALSRRALRRDPSHPRRLRSSPRRSAGGRSAPWAARSRHIFRSPCSL